MKVSFEELLLEKIKQEKKNSCQPPKKKRVAKGAEVITAAKLEEREKQDREKQVKEKKS